MNARQWNTAMFSALAALVVIAVPFLATAEMFDGGFTPDFDFGIDPMDDSGFTNDDSIGFTNDVNGGFTLDQDTGFVPENTGPGGQDDSVSGDGIWDPFDDDFGPIGGDIPGNPQGPDEQPELPEWPPVIPPVSCEQTGTCPVPVPTPSPSPSPESDDSLQIFIHNIFLHNPYEELPGDQVALRITFQNTGTHDLENTKVIIMIPDISVRATIGPMDVDAGEKVTSTVLLDLPEEVDEGTYSVRLQVYNEDAQRIVHREIEVIDYQ